MTTGKYASQTTVSSEQSRNEIERLLQRYGADQFAYATEPGKALVAFRIKGRAIRLTVPLPLRNEKAYTIYHRGSYAHARSEEGAERLWEQACRQRWRALVLVVKAKLEAAELGITTIDDEFLAHTVMPDGETFGAWARPQVEQMLITGGMPPLLALPRGDRP